MDHELGDKKWHVPVLRMRFPIDYPIGQPRMPAGEGDRLWRAVLFILVGFSLAFAMLVRG